MKLKMKTTKKIILLMICITIPLLIYGLYAQSMLMMGIGIAALAATYLFIFIFDRCPYCKQPLGRNAGDYCQHCGKRLYD